MTKLGLVQNRSKSDLNMDQTKTKPDLIQESKPGLNPGLHLV